MCMYSVGLLTLGTYSVHAQPAGLLIGTYTGNMPGPEGPRSEMIHR